MKLNGYNYHSYTNIENLELNISGKEVFNLFGHLFNEQCNNIYCSEGFRCACENGLIPFEVCERIHGTSDEFEYHHIAVLEEEKDSPTVLSVLFKNE